MHALAAARNSVRALLVSLWISVALIFHRVENQNGIIVLIK